MRKKILHVSAGGIGYGGVGTVILNIVESLHNEFDFECVVFNRKSDREIKFQEYGKIHRINSYPTSGKRSYKELLIRPIKLYFGIKKICKNNNIDIIHCHNQYDEALCLLAAKHANVSVRISHSHVTNSLTKKNPIEKLYKYINKYIINRTATVKVGCSEQACNQFYFKDDYIIIPNSIDQVRFNTKRKRYHKEINFIHVGRFNKAKNQEFVIEVFSKVCEQVNDAHLYMVGHGNSSIENDIINKVKMLGLEKKISVVDGTKEDVVDFYAIADYMIFPSKYEGFGIVLLEAQAMGILCFASQNVPTEVNCGLVDFLNLSDGAEKWAEHIIRSMNDDSRVCDDKELSRYKNDTVAHTYRDIYMGRNI